MTHRGQQARQEQATTIEAKDRDISLHMRLAASHQDLADHFTESAEMHRAKAAELTLERNALIERGGMLGGAALENVLPMVPPKPVGEWIG